MIRRSVITSSLLSLAIGAACASSDNLKSASSEEPSDFRQTDGAELVEIIIRLPDGRVIKRKERRIASRIEIDLTPGNSRPPIINGQSDSSGTVEVAGKETKGGSNSASMSTGSGGSGGGGSSSSSSGGGGGGGGGDTTDTRPPPGGHSGGSNDNQFSIVQPDSDLQVRFFAWDNTGASFDNIQKAFVADPRGKSPKLLATQIANRVRVQQPEKVALRFWKELAPATTMAFDDSNPRELVDSGGYTDGVTQYWTQFAIELKAQGVTPDYLIFDQEHGISFWHIPASDRRRFFSSLLDPAQQLSAALPFSMRGINVDQFLNYRHPTSRVPFNDYNQFAHEFRARYLRRVFTDAFESVYGHRILTSNYKDLYASFDVMQYTGRAMQTGTIDGISSPPLYIDRRATGAPRYQGTNKDNRWNRLIDQLNEARSAAQIGLVMPWIAPPGYGRNGPDTWAQESQLAEENWLWETKMSHLVAMGIDTYILWNPGTRFNRNAVANDDMMDEWLSQTPSVPTRQLSNLDEIPLDANQIVTNGVVTTYEDYLVNMGLADSNE